VAVVAVAVVWCVGCGVGRLLARGVWSAAAAWRGGPKVGRSVGRCGVGCGVAGCVVVVAGAWRGRLGDWPAVGGPESTWGSGGIVVTGRPRKKARDLLRASVGLVVQCDAGDPAVYFGLASLERSQCAANGYGLTRRVAVVVRAAPNAVHLALELA
jgi:hypothetical protein